MSTEFHKETVRRWFRVMEVVPGKKRDLDILDEFLTKDFVIHRPDLPEPVKGLENLKRFATRMGSDLYSELTMTIHDLIAEGDRVACLVSHRAVHRKELPSRLGLHAVAGRTASWQGMAIFRFHEGKIAEEWIVRDDLGMLLDLGVLSPDRSTSGSVKPRKKKV